MILHDFVKDGEHEVYSLSSIDNGNFLRPPSKSVPAMALIDPASDIPDVRAAKFYKNLRFMVFKVKQRGVKSYGKYKKRQTTKAIQLKQIIPGIMETMKDTHTETPFSLDYDNELFESLQTDEIYGMNWPYDHFSLVEAAKIDVDIEFEE